MNAIVITAEFYADRERSEVLYTQVIDRGGHIEYDAGAGIVKLRLEVTGDGDLADRAIRAAQDLKALVELVRDPEAEDLFHFLIQGEDLIAIAGNQPSRSSGVLTDLHLRVPRVERMGRPAGSARSTSPRSVCRCGHTKAQHSNAREDDYQCRVCDRCSGWSPA